MVLAANNNTEPRRDQEAGGGAVLCSVYGESQHRAQERSRGGRWSRAQERSSASVVFTANNNTEPSRDQEAGGGAVLCICMDCLVAELFLNS